MTLTEISYYFRRYVPPTLFFIIFTTLLYLVITMYIAYVNSTKPPALFINPLFGKLPYIQETVSLEKPLINESILDTIEGIPINSTSSARVFKLLQYTPKLGYIQNIYLTARTFGIDTETIKHRTEGNKAIFEDQYHLLTIDITNYNFTYTYKIASKEALIEDIYIPDEQTLKEQMKQFLRRAGRYPSELAQGKEVITFHYFDPTSNNILPADTPEQAQIIELDLYRPNIDSFPVYPPRYFNSQNYIAAVFSNKNGMQVIKAQIMFIDKKEDEWGVYPIKNGEQAWQDFQNGKGIIVSRGADNDIIKIKKMLFGYFDIDSYQPYLQPIYVFIGEQGMVSYVQAVSDEYATDSAYLN